MTGDCDSTTSGQDIVHATCVAIGRQGVLVTGASGSGKSALALELMAYGAVLVADDRVQLMRTEGGLVARAPATIRGLIEARGVGLLRADTADWARIALIVDLDTVETERLPPRRSTRVLDHEVSLVHKVEHKYFPAAILQYLKGSRQA